MLMLKADWSREVTSISKLPAISADRKHFQKSFLPLYLACFRVPAHHSPGAKYPLLLSLSHLGLCRPR